MVENETVEEIDVKELVSIAEEAIKINEPIFKRLSEI